MTGRTSAIGLLAVLAAVAVFGQGSIVNSPHNLSVSGPGAVKADSESRICVFCHTPHNSTSQAPLWNRSDPGGTYDMYWSLTLDAYPSAAAAPQPSGTSKLCLSCHDGTIALGSTVASGTITISGGVTTMPTGSTAFLGLDLTGEHPFSFTLTDALVETNNAKGDVPLRTVAEIRSSPLPLLDDADRIQCTSCHDPHSYANDYFILTAETADLCLGCHQ